MVASEPLAVRLRPALRHGVAYTALSDALRGQILDGRLLIGQTLPSERALAESLALSRATVTAAYSTLRAEGYLTSRRGSGTVAVLPTREVERPDGAEPLRLDLTIAALPAPAGFSALTTRAIEHLPEYLAGHGLHPLGLPVLRAAIARRYHCSPDQILITQGALHGWDLILRALARPGDPVLVEQPTYPAVVDAALAHRVRAIPLGVDADGWQLPRLNRSPVLAHITPEHQNPTGHVADRSAFRPLERTLGDTVIVRDETFADLTLEGAVTTLPRRGVAVGSLSKSVWAGLRVGWIRADRATVARLAMSRTSQDQATPVLEQLVAVEVLAELDAILVDRRRVLRARRDHLLAELGRLRPDWIAHRPRGGMVAWVDLGALSSTRLAAQVRAEGVRVSAGTRFSVTGTHERFLRLPFTLPEPMLTTAVVALARAAQARPGRRIGGSATWTA